MAQLMINFKEVRLKSSKAHSVLRRHPWIFSGAIHSKEKDIQNGEIVRVSLKEDTLGYGHFQDGSIAVRMLQYGDTPIDSNFWMDRLTLSLEQRKTLHILSSSTNAFRLIHGEGDGLPGLIVDIYDSNAVIQCHSAGMYLSRKSIADALMSILNIDTVYVQAHTSLHKFIPEAQDAMLYGDRQECTIKENDVSFSVNWVTGQKTGFFLDQRDNRALLEKMSKGKRILNCFCYSGGFSMYALRGGASHVTSIDISKTATDLVQKNHELNSFGDNHTILTTNVMDHLAQETEDYDIVIIDPPAFAKSIKKRHNAVQAYKRLNSLAIRRVKKGGFLYTFSCSQVVNKELFEHTVRAAAIDTRTPLQVIKNLSQGSDHPVNIYHPEGQYLKGLVLYRNE